jgi:hypothetical protein
MMDLMILVAVFIAILALAYFTYRNIVGLDTRLRKIEDVLKNAEVVAAPVNERIPASHEQTHEHTPASGIPGWGGEGPEVNVERVDSDTPATEPRVVDITEDEEYPADDDQSDDEHSDDDDDDESVSENTSDIAGGSGEDGDDERSDGGDDIRVVDGEGEGEGEGDDSKRPRGGNIRVSDLRDALKKAGVSFPNGAKKALLMSLVEQNNVELSG